MQRLFLVNFTSRYIYSYRYVRPAAIKLALGKVVTASFRASTRSADQLRLFRYWGSVSGERDAGGGVKRRFVLFFRSQQPLFASEPLSCSISLSPHPFFSPASSVFAPQPLQICKPRQRQAAIAAAAAGDIRLHHRIVLPSRAASCFPPVHELGREMVI